MLSLLLLNFTLFKYSALFTKERFKANALSFPILAHMISFPIINTIEADNFPSTVSKRQFFLVQHIHRRKLFLLNHSPFE